jgi:hypothetical protein
MWRSLWSVAKASRPHSLVIAGVRQIGVVGGILLAHGHKVFRHPIDHWLEQVVFLRHSVHLRINDYLMPAIDCGDANITLQHVVTALERGTLGVGEVSLEPRAFGAEWFGRGGQRGAQLGGALAQGGDGAFSMLALVVLIGIQRLDGILLGMCLDQMRDGAFHFRRLALEVGARADPFPEGVRGQLATMNGQNSGQSRLCVSSA